MLYSKNYLTVIKSDMREWLESLLGIMVTVYLRIKLYFGFIKLDIWFPPYIDMNMKGTHSTTMTKTGVYMIKILHIHIKNGLNKSQLTDWCSSSFSRMRLHMRTATSRFAFKVGKWTSDANFTLSSCVSLISVALSRISNSLSTSRSALFSCTDNSCHTNNTDMIERFLYYIVQISNTPYSTIQLPITVVPQFWIVHEHRRIAIRNETRGDNMNDWLAHDCYGVRVLCCVRCFNV